jgi:quinol monooxygenase YgiN
MVNKGLLVRLEARHGKDFEVEELLRRAVPLVRQEPGTAAWFGIKFGRFEYGIFDVFPDDAARAAHLAGPVARSLMEHADLFTGAPEIRNLDIIADKLPEAWPPGQHVEKGLLLTFLAKAGRETQMEQFLRDARRYVLEEPKTAAWFALRLSNVDYGIFDVFPDNAGRLAHLTGHVPRELMKNALTLLGSIPDMEMLEVVAEKLDREEHRHAA